MPPTDNQSPPEPPESNGSAPNANCPSDKVLNGLFTGKLHVDAANKVLDHLRECAPCAKRLDEIRDADDSFVASEVVAAGNLEETIAFRRATERIREFAPASTSAGLQTSNYADPEDRYTVGDTHASGGVGQVWLARDNAIGRDVALKMLREEHEQTENSTARFLTEARVTGQLEHPGIVPVYDLGSRNGKLFYAMRFVRGETLHDAAQKLAQRRDAGNLDMMSLRRLIDAVVSVANAVAFAHSRGVLHRDLKGKNIVLGDYGEVIVLDWGLARLMESEEADPAALETVTISATDSTARTEDGRVVGTPAFMAPEQAAARRDLMNERTDVYGIGAVLYQVLTGEAPFGEGESSRILERVLTEPVARPRTHWQEVPRALDAICMKALSREQSDRYESPSDVASELKRWLADEPVLAYADPILDRLGRWSRRHRSMVAAGIALVATALVALGTTTLLVAKEQRRTAAARSLAEENFNRARDAVDRMLSKVGDERLRNVPHMGKLQRQLLEEAVEFNEAFLLASDDPDVRYEAGLARLRLAGLYMQLGRSGDAMKANRSAIDLLNQLHTDEPELPAPAHGLASALLNYAEDLQSLGHQKEAVRFCEMSIAIQRKLVGQPDGLTEAATEWLGLLAAALKTRGLFYDTDSNDEAEEAAYRDSMAILDRIPTTGQSSRSVMLQRAAVSRLLAQELSSKSKLVEASQLLENAQSILQEAVDSFPGDRAVLEAAVALQNMLLTHNRRIGKRDHSLAELRRFEDLSEQLANEYPYIQSNRQRLVDTYASHAIAHAQAGRSDEAGELFLKSAATADALQKEYPEVPQHWSLAGRAWRLVGTFETNSSRMDDAFPFFQKAIDLQNQLVANHPNVADHRYQLALSFHGLGAAQARSSKNEEAIESIKRSSELLRTLSEESPRVLSYPHKLGQNYRIHARLLDEMKAIEEAARLHGKAVAIHRQICVLAPDVPRHRRQLAIALHMLAEHHFENGQYTAAQTPAREAVGIRRKIVANEPNWFDAQTDLIVGYGLLGQILRNLGQADEAEQYFVDGIAICEGLTNQDLGSEAVTREHAQFIRFIGNLRHDSKEYSKALKLLAQAEKMFRQIHKTRPDRDEFVYRLRECLADQANAQISLEQREAAVATIDEMLQTEPFDDWEDHVVAAKLLAKCISIKPGLQRNRLTGRVIGQFKLAVRKGLPDIRELLEAEEFDAIRDSPEFKAYLSE